MKDGTDSWLVSTMGKKFGRTDRDFFGLFAAGSESDDVDVLSCLDVELGRSVQNQVR